ncbi:hypothetical protein M011DRAFT_450878 [Sporormia fimetaria CBS 119925]|uniref:Centromere protein Cenp-K n=1 Tax=Sporormia fimetaria CBS 119925 TaxID=1340428 RepID=A0A6A6V1I6_9PLEO|nr:hypothetical protein M011DRAFT_450878 [Sporormia fimetaria CBS 119925]
MAQQARDETLARIRQYAAQARELQETQMDMDASATETRLESTIQELQNQVEQQKAALETSNTDLSSAAYASSDPRTKLQQLHRLKHAYTRLTPTAPFLPSKGSALPALLALRTVQQNVHGTKEAIRSTEYQIRSTEARLRKEEANLRDVNLLTQTMEKRIQQLQTQQEQRSIRSPEELAQELIIAKRERKRVYDEKTQQLGEDFNLFVEQILSPMLAAEELGGPVVGDMPEVGESTLAVGFTKRGAAKKAKKAPSDKLRQKKIDQIWGNMAVGEGGEELSEAEAADQEMRALVEKLFTKLHGPGGGKEYVEIERDSAAARFLVRAKIAQFHPRDARRLRMIDFGRELNS